MTMRRERNADKKRRKREEDAEMHGKSTCRPWTRRAVHHLRLGRTLRYRRGCVSLQRIHMDVMEPWKGTGTDR